MSCMPCKFYQANKCIKGCNFRHERFACETVRILTASISFTPNSYVPQPTGVHQLSPSLPSSVPIANRVGSTPAPNHNWQLQIKTKATKQRQLRTNWDLHPRQEGFLRARCTVQAQSQAQDRRNKAAKGGVIA